MFFNLFKKSKEKLIKKKLECEHEWIKLGKYYTVYDSPYRNQLDEVYIYLLLICSKCGEVKNKRLSTRGFAPVMFNAENLAKRYINELPKDIIPKWQMQEAIFDYQMENNLRSK